MNEFEWMEDVEAIHGTYRNTKYLTTYTVIEVINNKKHGTCLRTIVSKWNNDTYVKWYRYDTFLDMINKGEIYEDNK